MALRGAEIQMLHSLGRAHILGAENVYETRDAGLGRSRCWRWQRLSIYADEVTANVEARWRQGCQQGIYANDRGGSYL